MERQVQVLSSKEGCPSLPIVEGPGEALAIVWPGVGARFRSMHKISLGEGGKTTRMKHAGEAVYYVASGSVAVSDDATEYIAGKGAMVFVEPETPYVLAAHEGHTEMIGGPCPPDPKLYEGISHGD
jgi:mannose-6-phosphate isomerase-like protein (cupin superfamily)